MSDVRRSVDVGVPPGDLWKLLEDVRRLPELSSSTVAVDDAPDRLSETGQTFQQTVKLAGKRFRSTWTVTAIDPGHMLRIEGSILPGTHYAMTETITALDGGRSRLELEMAYKLPFGPVGRLAGRLGAEKKALDEASEVLDGIRRVAEAEHRPTG